MYHRMHMYALHFIIHCSATAGFGDDQNLKPAWVIWSNADDVFASTLHWGRNPALIWHRSFQINCPRVKTQSQKNNARFLEARKLPPMASSPNNHSSHRSPATTATASGSIESAVSVTHPVLVTTRQTQNLEHNTLLDLRFAHPPVYSQTRFRRISRSLHHHHPRPRLFQKDRCQADGCTESLKSLPFYNRRNHICMPHKTAPSFFRLGELVRFCQRCGLSHSVTLFDGEKRSCRMKLEKHNARRRKNTSTTPAVGNDLPASSSYDALQQQQQQQQQQQEQQQQQKQKQQRAFVVDTIDADEEEDFSSELADLGVTSNFLPQLPLGVDLLAPPPPPPGMLPPQQHLLNSSSSEGGSGGGSGGVVNVAATRNYSLTSAADIHECFCCGTKANECICCCRSATRTTATTTVPAARDTVDDQPSASSSVPLSPALSLHAYADRCDGELLLPTTKQQCHQRLVGSESATSASTATARTPVFLPTLSTPLPSPPSGQHDDSSDVAQVLRYQLQRSRLLLSCAQQVVRDHAAIDSYVTSSIYNYNNAMNACVLAF